MEMDDKYAISHPPGVFQSCSSIKRDSGEKRADASLTRY